MMFFFLFFSLARGAIYSLLFDNERKGEKVYWWDEKGNTSQKIFFSIFRVMKIHIHSLYR